LSSCTLYGIVLAKRHSILQAYSSECIVPPVRPSPQPQELHSSEELPMAIQQVMVLKAVEAVLRISCPCPDTAG
jgi:hypothetical protein